VTVKGFILVSACAFIKNLQKPVSRNARLPALRAALRGCLADDGTIYWPISAAMPATGQNPRLVKLAGQRVIAAGRFFERVGSRAMVIDKIEAAPVNR
jgi:hypothetical protein